MFFSYCEKQWVGYFLAWLSVRHNFITGVAGISVCHNIYFPALTLYWSTVFFSVKVRK